MGNLHSLSNKAAEIIAKLSASVPEYSSVFCQLIRDWKKIMIQEVYKYSIPVKVSFFKDHTVGGKIWLVVPNSSAAMFIKMHEHIIISNLSSYFGYKAVDKLGIKINTFIFNRRQKLSVESLEIEANIDDETADIALDLKQMLCKVYQ